MQGRPLLHLLPVLRVTGSWWPPRIAAVSYLATQAGGMVPWLMLRRRQAATPRLRATITLALALVLVLTRVLVLVLVLVMVLMRGWRQIVMVLMVLMLLLVMPMLLMALQLHRRPTSVPRSVPPSGLPLMWVPQPWAA